MKRTTQKKLRAALAAAALFLPVTAGTEEIKRIQDNSFLLEEAYNQEPGVVQHIQSFQYLAGGRTWAYAFTQEWPAPGQAHQLSFTLPVNRQRAPADSAKIGDLLLNYRYQLAANGPVALAPRFSLALPTGDHRKGFGSGAVGGQVNLPLSVELSDRWVTHWNAGAAYTPGARGAGGGRADTLAFNYGAGAVYSAGARFNLLLEAVWTSFETVLPGGGKTREETAFLNPGVRSAIDFKSGLQIVPGLSFPVGLGPSKAEHGVLGYVSFEHPF